MKFLHSLFFQILAFLYSHFYGIFRHLGMKNEHHLSGDLLVSGKNSVLVPLSPHKAPSLVAVEFKPKHHHHHHPCNHHIDQLNWKLNSNDDGSYSLLIEFDVEGMRDIFWQVFYPHTAYRD